MQSSRSTRELVARLKSSPVSSQCQHVQNQCLRLRLPLRPFHSTSQTQQKRKPKFRNLTQAEMDAAMKTQFPEYTKEDKQLLNAKYNKAQVAAIEAGEAAITARDLQDQAAIRRDYFIPPYLDDFSRIEPVIDKKLEKTRGEEQDYENAVEPFHVPKIPEEWITIAELRLDNQHVGKWIEDGFDEQGEPKLVYEGREHELDYFAQKAYLKTPECKAYMEQQLSPMLGEDAGLPDARELEREHQIEKAEEAERVAAMGDQDDDEDVIYEYDEKDDDDNGKPVRGRRQGQRNRVDDDTLAFDPTMNLSVDYSTQPKYQEIRQQLVEAGPMRRKYGFGSTHSEREIERISQGPEPDVAPDIPKIDDPSLIWGTDMVDDEAESQEEEGESLDENSGLEDEALASYQRVSKILGQSIKQLQKYRVKTLVSHRVVNQTRLGKVESMYYLVVAGDMNGNIGIGEGKGTEMDEAVRMARLNAIRHMGPILRYERRTIYGDVEGKSGATIVQLSARRPGFGVRANAHIFEIMRCAGIQDLSARVPRSRNPMNVAKAVFKALRAQRDPEEIARGRGKKMVDVRKVYYSGLV